MSDVGDNISSETQIVFVEASGQLWLNLLVSTSDDKRSERYLRFFVVLDNCIVETKVILWALMNNRFEIEY